MTDENHHEETDEIEESSIDIEDNDISDDRLNFWEKNKVYIIAGALIGICSVMAFLLGANQVCINDDSVLGTGLVCLKEYEVDKVCFDPNDWRLQRIQERGVNIDDLLTEG